MIPVVWTKYTATLPGRVLKLVLCENCSTEYVYVLEREGQGIGTSVYMLKDDGAQEHAAAAAEDTLREYLENDFDPVPCPICGHYQRYMFPKLYGATSPWLAVASLAVLAAGSLDAVGALYWSVTYLQQSTNHALVNMVVTWSLLAVLGLIGVGLAAIERSKARRFDPNTEDQPARIERGRSRAVTRAEFEATQQRVGKGPEKGTA
ncbi:MAG TPA: hypothetical protein VN688_23315 [Gemmataceae bacterium]|nr:hypothetical protein [Gemmataceae bacterium]